MSNLERASSTIFSIIFFISSSKAQPVVLVINLSFYSVIIRRKYLMYKAFLLMNKISLLTTTLLNSVFVSNSKEQNLCVVFLDYSDNIIKLSC